LAQGSVIDRHRQAKIIVAQQPYFAGRVRDKCCGAMRALRRDLACRKIVCRCFRADVVDEFEAIACR
jgi:hypothetical protein